MSDDVEARLRKLEQKQEHNTWRLEQAEKNIVENKASLSDDIKEAIQQFKEDIGEEKNRVNGFVKVAGVFLIAVIFAILRAIFKGIGLDL